MARADRFDDQRELEDADVGDPVEDDEDDGDEDIDEDDVDDETRDFYQEFV